MRIVVALDDAAAERWARLYHGPLDASMFVNTFATLQAAIATESPDCIVWDPARIRGTWPAPADSMINRASAICVARAGATLVFYSEPSVDLMDLAALFMRTHRVYLIARGARDELSQITLIQALIADGQAATALSARLEARLESLPVAARSLLMALLRQPTVGMGVREIVAGVGVSERSLERWLAKAGLAAPRRFVDAARVMVAYAALARGRMQFGVAGLDSLVQSPQALRKLTRRCLGTTPRALRHLSSGDLVDRLMLYLVLDGGPTQRGRLP